MEWEALLDDACPNCGEMLDLDSAKENNGLIVCPCDFKIHEDRKAELCQKIEDQLEDIDQPFYNE